MTSSPETAPIPLRLADRIFLAAHAGDQRLSPTVDPSLVALGCAGGLLAELILDEEITVTPTVRASGPGRCPDYLSWVVLREIRQEQGLDLRTWLEYLAQTATEKVRARLTIIDVLREVSVSTGWRSGPATAWRVTEDGPPPVAEQLGELFTGTESVAGTGMITGPDVLREIVFALLARETGAVRQLRLSRQAARQGEHRMESWEPRIPGPLRAVVNEVAAAREQSAMTPRY
ncbi:GOLPH3/VPS74 family protein [Saccharopolyspora taberi]|uniref:GPP34 family phosphoprotein n=1 Tax=Saccharopolyspora taberi TaxID=60895 RepID=A0ABN3VDF3_9PSEU